MYMCGFGGTIPRTGRITSKQWDIILTHKMVLQCSVRAAASDLDVGRVWAYLAHHSWAL